MDCSLPGFSVLEIFQARTLEWVAIPSPGDLPDPGIEPMSDSLSLSHEGSPEAHTTQIFIGIQLLLGAEERVLDDNTFLLPLWFYCLVAKSRPTLCDRMDCNPQGSSVHRVYLIVEQG